MSKFPVRILLYFNLQNWNHNISSTLFPFHDLSSRCYGEIKIGWFWAKSTLTQRPNNSCRNKELESQRDSRGGVHCVIQVNHWCTGEFSCNTYWSIDNVNKNSSNVLWPFKFAGMLMYYILSGGKHPFNVSKSFQLESNIDEGKYSLDDVQDVVAKDLIEWMINKEPTDRPRVEQCLSHPFFWPYVK